MNPEISRDQVSPVMTPGAACGSQYTRECILGTWALVCLLWPHGHEGPYEVDRTSTPFVKVPHDWDLGYVVFPSVR